MRVTHEGYCEGPHEASFIKLAREGYWKARLGEILCDLSMKDFWELSWCGSYEACL